MNDDFLNNTLGYTDAKRRRLLDQIESENEGIIPTDPGRVRIYLKALSDMDNAAVSHARVKTEEKGVDNDAAVAEIIRDVVRKLDGKNPYRAEVAVEGRVAPTLPEDIEASVEVDEATLESGKIQETVDEFNKRLGLEED